MAVRALAGVTFGVAIHPANNRILEVNEMDVSSPLPVGAVIKKNTVATAQATCPGTKDRLSAAASGSEDKGKQSASPGSPCSSMMRAYSFSTATGLRNSAGESVEKDEGLER
jgi:hypothetical protein